MSEPYNIRRYKQQSEEQHRREEAVRNQNLEASRTSWYDKANRQLPNPKDIERSAEVMEKDLKLAAEQLAKARRERLRELYNAEMAGWQAELGAKGLAIEVRRD